MSKSKVVTEEKRDVFHNFEQVLIGIGLKVQEKDENRPWGGFFVIDPECTSLFIDHFFKTAPISQVNSEMQLSPKILIIQPNQRLSWQYHHRRSEIWTVTEGEVGVITSETDEQGDLKVLKKGDLIQLGQGERHRLVGLDDWAVVAEIWQHTDPDEPSDEEDIIRLQDDYGR